MINSKKMISCATFFFVNIIIIDFFVDCSNASMALLFGVIVNNSVNANKIVNAVLWRFIQSLLRKELKNVTYVT